MRMIKIITLEELNVLLIEPIKDTIQSVIDAFEDMQKLTEELKVISDDKDTYSYAFYQIQYFMPKVKFKRLWKRQKIP